MARPALVLIALLLVCAAHAAGAPAAMVTDVKGPAAGLSLGRTLEEGATLELGAGTRIRLIYLRGPAQGRRETIQGPAAVRVDGAGSRVTPARALVVERVTAPRNLVPSGGVQRIGGSIEREAVHLALLPTLGAPRFLWSVPVPGESTLRVLDGDRVHWEARTTRRMLDYGGPPLVPDHRYTWTVEHEGLTATPQPFRLVSEATRQGLQAAREQAAALAGADDPTPHLLMMGLYLDQDMLEEAASEARAALEIRPDEALREQLVLLLRAVRGWDAPPAES